MRDEIGRAGMGGAPGGVQPVQQGAVVDAGQHGRVGRRLAGLAPGWTLRGEHDVMGRISALHRAVAATFHTVTRGARLYAIAHLEAT
ncbi:hypothetical protein [Amycolatopsis sp. GM8]|uniref:hypothetical protein n=1 Tax=Amycolatopsis sp. GM8 TaxID=2896530 RepID=UPI001F3A0D01|nr:hypothetical protein [Amycolatopsis sp. GM8]